MSRPHQPAIPHRCPGASTLPSQTRDISRRTTSTGPRRARGFGSAHHRSDAALPHAALTDRCCPHGPRGTTASAHLFGVIWVSKITEPFRPYNARYTSDLRSSFRFNTRRRSPVYHSVGAKAAAFAVTLRDLGPIWVSVAWQRLGTAPAGSQGSALAEVRPAGLPRPRDSRALIPPGDRVAAHDAWHHRRGPARQGPP